MGITKSLMNTGSRAIFNRMSGLFKDSPRLQGLVAKGADLISPDGPDKSTTSNALVDLFKRKGLTLLQDQLSNGSKAGFVQSLLSSDNAKPGFLMKAAFVVAPALAVAITVLGKLTSALKEASARTHNQTPLGDLIKAGETATPAAAAPRSPADEKISDLEWEIQLAKDVGRGLQANLDKAKSTPGVHPGLIADFESQIADNTRKLQQKQTELQALQNPSEPARAGTDLARKGSGAPAARSASAAACGCCHAIVEQGKMFGHQADTLMANEPVPEDWNRPKDFIPDNWDQPAGPSR